MTQKTQKKSQESNAVSNVQVAVASTMTQDLKNAVLIVSVVANLFILTAWIALQVTTKFDSQLSSFLFTR